MGSGAGTFPEGRSAGVRAIILGCDLSGTELRPLGLQRERRAVNIVHDLYVSEGRRRVQAAGPQLGLRAGVGAGFVEVLRLVAPVRRFVSFAVSQLRLVLLLANTKATEVMRRTFITSVSTPVVRLPPPAASSRSATVAGRRVTQGPDRGHVRHPRLPAGPSGGGR